MKILSLRVVLSLGFGLLACLHLSAAGSHDDIMLRGAAPLASTGNSELAQMGSDRFAASVDDPVIAESRSQLAQQTLAKPNGRVLLTISGAIDNTNVDGKAKFDREMLLKLGTSTIRTTTSWTDGVPVFEGVPASEVMRAVGAYGSTAYATALNDYVVEIPVGDFERYGVIFALSKDGKELSVRDKGPIWAIYPRDDFPELRNRASDKKWIWQLVTIDIR